MVSLTFLKAAFLSILLAEFSQAAHNVESGSFRNTRAKIADIKSTPRPTGTWISPEYKWIFEHSLPTSPIKASKFTYTNENTGAIIDYYEVEVKSFEKKIYPDLPATQMVGYDGMSPGPMFVMQNGREAVVRFSNHGPTNMSVHVHGQYNRAPFDGWAGDYALPGQFKDYYYPNAQNARSIWYHDHTEYSTGENAYRGQEGYYIITDKEEQALGLPKGNYDVALALGAKVYNGDGSLNYDTNGHSGLYGDIIQVNGQPWPYLNVEPRKYRFRLLNGAVSRVFSISFAEGLDGEILDFDAIASDGGLFSHPVRSNKIALSMGERYEIVVDFSNHAGKNVTARNDRGIGDGIDYAATDLVMRFVVGDSVTDKSNNGDVPQFLRDIPPPPETKVSKDFAFERVDDEWLINGVGFSDVENRILTRPALGEDEIWTLRNGNGNGTHPVHIHLVDFQVLSRTGGRGTVLPYESAGMKDVVWLGGGETVQVVARYAPWDGVYMFHCHNLVHEDHDMLVAFNVTQLEKWGYNNSTMFIDPKQPEFRPKPINAADFTEKAILKKLAWFYSTNAYNQTAANPAPSATATLVASVDAISGSIKPTKSCTKSKSSLITTTAKPTTSCTKSKTLLISTAAKTKTPCTKSKTSHISTATKPATSCTKSKTSPTSKTTKLLRSKVSTRSWSTVTISKSSSRPGKGVN